jgi:hypothetical protein
MARGRGKRRKTDRERMIEFWEGQERSGSGGWEPRASEPPDAGVIEGTDDVVSFKTGGPTGDQTLIRDGDYSDDKDGFDGLPGDRHHNHYGSRQEDDGWIDQDRGYYTGPDH